MQLTMEVADELLIEIIPGYYSTSSTQIINALIKNLSKKFPNQIKLTLRVEREESEDYEETVLSFTFGTGITANIEYF
jgi:hypothetical protein